jgi:hypothetical protein
MALPKCDRRENHTKIGPPPPQQWWANGIGQRPIRSTPTPGTGTQHLAKDLINHRAAGGGEGAGIGDPAKRKRNGAKIVPPFVKISVRHSFSRKRSPAKCDGQTLKSSSLKK